MHVGPKSLELVILRTNPMEIGILEVIHITVIIYSENKILCIN